MIQLSPELTKITRIVPSSKRILGLTRNVEFRALSADGRTAHGLSPVLAILDELGQVRGPQSDFVDAIITAQGAHKNPLQMVISTQARLLHRSGYPTSSRRYRRRTQRKAWRSAGTC